MAVSQITSPATQAQLADVFVPFFGKNHDLTNPSWWVEITESPRFGQVNERCVVHCMNDEVDEPGYSVALQPEGIADKLRPGTDMCVKKRTVDSNGGMQYEIVFIGYVAAVEHISAADGLQLECYSNKDRLRDVKIVGSWCWDGLKLVYRRGVDLHMNPGGRPNWIFTPDGVPVPAAHADYGLSADEEVPDYKLALSTKSTYCNLGMAIEYLRIFHGPKFTFSGATNAAIALAEKDYPDLVSMRAPSWLAWNADFAEKVNTDQFNNQSQGNQSLGGARKGRDMSFGGGMSLIGDRGGKPGALDLLFDACGSYSYAVLPVAADPDDYEMILQAVATRPVDGAAATTMQYTQGAVVDVPTLTAPRLRLDVGNTVTRVLGLGSRVKMEGRFDGPTILKPNWSQADFDACMRLAVERTGTGSTYAVPEAMQFALDNYPSVLRRWIVDPQTNFVEFISEFANMQQAHVPRPPLPFLLSYQGGGNVANDIVHLPIIVEVLYPDPQTGANEWVAVRDPVKIIAWDNGVIEIPDFAAIGVQYSDPRPGPFKPNYSSVTAGKLNATIRAIRFTAAFELDQCLEAGLVTPDEDAPGADDYKQDTDYADTKKISDGFSRLKVLDLKGLYEQWVSDETAFPIPESRGGEATGTTEKLRYDNLLLAAHIRKSMRYDNRLSVSGPLIMDGYLCTTYNPGDLIDYLAPYGNDQAKKWPADFVVQGVVWRTVRTRDPELNSDTFKNSTEIIPG